MSDRSLESLLEAAFQARLPLPDAEHRGARRLFAGFYEGQPDLVIDLYGCTLLLFDFSASGNANELLDEAQRIALERFPWIKCVLRKTRATADSEGKLGRITFGSTPDTSISENGVQYALDLTMGQDAGFYLDTRNLRAWVMEHARGLEVLNTFAYTGSLGLAALAGGASRVVQLDRNARYLDLARRSAMLNRFDLGRMKLRVEDFFSAVGKFKRDGSLFDLVILDPPFFSVSARGRVDQLAESGRLINKVRPLVRDGGRIVAINNALFLSGRETMDQLDGLCRDGYLRVEEIIPVPEDITGYDATRVGTAPVETEPFNHPTKIAVLAIKRKSAA